MNRFASTLVLAFITLAAAFQPVSSQSFVSHGNNKGSSRETPQEEEPFIDTTSSRFGKSFDDFNASLGSAHLRMKEDYEDSLKATAKRQALEAKANELDANAQLQGAFQNTQAQALNSGGLYNTPGGGYGGGGGFVVPNLQGRYYGTPSSSPRRAGMYRSGGGGRRH